MVLIAHVEPFAEGVAIYQANNVEMLINNKNIGMGSLYISQQEVAWQPNNINSGITISWKEISVHGISVMPRKSIYFFIDENLVWPGIFDDEAQEVNGDANNENGVDVHNADGAMDAVDNVEDEGNETDEENEDEGPKITEFFLVPEDVNQVDTMFHAMNECQALNPDSEDSLSDESIFMDDEDDDDDDDNNLGHVRVNGNQVGGAAVPPIENLHLSDDDDDNRFEDAQEE